MGLSVIRFVLIAVVVGACYCGGFPEAACGELRRPDDVIGMKLRQHILRRDKFRCKICGRCADDGVKLEVDHKTPVSKGGSNNEVNLWTLCDACNRGKGDNWDDGDDGDDGSTIPDTYIELCAGALILGDDLKVLHRLLSHGHSFGLPDLTFEVEDSKYARNFGDVMYALIKGRGIHDSWNENSCEIYQRAVELANSVKTGGNSEDLQRIVHRTIRFIQNRIRAYLGDECQIADERDEEEDLRLVEEGTTARHSYFEEEQW